MLQCPPTRIPLSPADLADFQRRFNARHAMRDAQLRPAGLRIKSGPSRSTNAGIVGAERNIARRRAESCASRATICSDSDEQTELPIPSIITTAAPSSSHLQPSHPNVSPRDLPWQQGESFLESSHRSLIRLDLGQNASNRHPRDLSGVDIALRSNPPRPPRPSVEPRRRPLGREPEKFQLFRDDPVMQRFVERTHLADYEQLHRHHTLDHQSGYQGLDRGPIVTHRPPPQHGRNPQANPNLDPVAPVFVPRTRFGSITTTPTSDNGTGHVRPNGRPQQASTATHHNAANLRPRSSFERNSQYGFHQAPRPSAFDREGNAQHRRRSRGHDQNTILPSLAPVVDRYPRPNVPAFASRRSSGSQRPVVFPRRRSSRQHLVDYERSLRSGFVERPTVIQSQQSLLTVPGTEDERPSGPRTVSPAPSSSSRSTPNLLRSPPALPAPTIHARSSSLTWSQGPGTEEAGQRGHGKAFTDGTEYDISADTSSTLDISSALEQFPLNRNSPLDELTQRLSRMATSRPRSVGRSFERPPGRNNRISLLSGDPFRQDSSPERSEADEYEGYEVVHPPADSRVRDSVVSCCSATTEDPVALALALPPPDVPLSPTSTSSPGLPSTPATAIQDASSPRSPTTISSAMRASQTMMTMTPAGPPTATPRVPVYSDAQPAELQPQTPADIARPSTRRHGRSETVSQRHGVLAGSPALPAEKNSNRHTYPAASPQANQIEEQTGGIRVTPSQPASLSQRESALMRLDQRSSNSSSENDIEGGLEGLDEDRRVWMGRRDDGSLETTPPAEGRWARYLS